MKKRKKLFITIGAIAAVVIVLLLMVNNARGQAEQANETIQTKALQKTTLADTVDVTGTVQSQNNAKVYSPVATLSIKTVNVKVGDKVNAGDVLCQLNTDNLDKQIEQSQATLDAAKSNGSQTVKTNQTKYENDVKNLQNGQNTTINQANAAVDSARYALDQAMLKYNAAHAAFLAASPTDITYDSLKQADEAANSAASAASKAYDNAVLAQQAAQNAVNQQIELEKQAVNTSKAAANTDAQQAALEALQLQRSQATVTAPKSGTVTAVNAVEGGSSTGLLFTIDDTDNLEIDTTIKEYDVNNVTLGMDCSIQSDGTGEDVYQGKLKSIEPAAVQSSSSLTSTGTSSGDVKFNAVITVTSADTKLKIGMKASVSIILNQKDDVLAVPYDAVATNAAGEKVVYALNKDANGKNSFQEIPVNTGMENDFYIEVSGKGLQEGMQIVSNPDSIPALKLQRAQASALASGSATAEASAEASAAESK